MSNGGVLELMMRYLKAVGRRFLEEWPRGLAAVVLEVHQAWRRHSMGLPNPLLRDGNDQHLRVTEEKSKMLTSSVDLYWDVPLDAETMTKVFQIKNAFGSKRVKLNLVFKLSLEKSSNFIQNSHIFVILSFHLSDI